MVKLRDEGLVRSIGVSNFTEEHLRRIIDATGVVPVDEPGGAAPLLPAGPLRAVHAELGVVTESWSPLGRGELLSEPTVTAIAEAHGVTPGAGDPALARAAGRRADPEVGRPGAGSARTSTSSGSRSPTRRWPRCPGWSAGGIWGRDPDTHEEF